jgi:hypothetical protein
MPCHHGQIPRVASVVQQVHRFLNDFENAAECTPAKVGEISEWTSIVNSSEENRANFCKTRDEKPLFCSLYGMYRVILNELMAVINVSSHKEQSSAVNKTSVESTVQDDDVWEVKRFKKRICNYTSQTAKKSTSPNIRSCQAASESSVNSQISSHLSELLTWTRRLLEQDTLRKSGRPPSIMMTSTTILIRLQGALNEQVKGEHKFRNTRKGTRIISNERAVYSAMKSYMEKNNLHYFTFFSNSEKPIKAVIHHFPPDTLEKISNSFQD